MNDDDDSSPHFSPFRFTFGKKSTEESFSFLRKMRVAAQVPILMVAMLLASLLACHGFAPSRAIRPSAFSSSLFNSESDDATPSEEASAKLSLEEKMALCISLRCDRASSKERCFKQRRCVGGWLVPILDASYRGSCACTRESRHIRYAFVSCCTGGMQLHQCTTDVSSCCTYLKFLFECPRLNTSRPWQQWHNCLL